MKDECYKIHEVFFKKYKAWVNNKLGIRHASVIGGRSSRMRNKKKS